MRPKPFSSKLQSLANVPHAHGGSVRSNVVKAGPRTGHTSGQRKKHNEQHPKNFKEGETSAGKRTIRQPTFSRSLQTREYAIRQLMRVEEEGGFIGRMDSVTDPRAAKRQRLDGMQQRTVTGYVANITRLKRRLDWRISQLATQPLKSIHPVLLQNLFSAVMYDLFEMEEPSHAVKDHVDLATMMVGTWATGFANAIGRRAGRIAESGSMMVPDKPAPTANIGVVADSMAIVYSHPTWMVKRWLRRFGEADTESLLNANNRTPAYGVRANSLKGLSSYKLASQVNALGGEAKPSGFLPREFCRVEAGLQQIVGSGMCDRGLCMVQDEATGLVVSVLDPKPGERVLDACAAPGGKALFIAARMKNQGSLLAMDSHARRLRTLARAAERCGIGDMLSIVPGSVHEAAAGKLTLHQGSYAFDSSQTSDSRQDEEAEQRPADRMPVGVPKGFQKDIYSRGRNLRTEDEETDAGFDGSSYDMESLDAAFDMGEESDGSASPPGDLPQFDRVLLDVPCSGLGVLSKRADLRWRRSPKDLDTIVKAQAEMMRAAAKLVKPGGLLVYSTCSIEPEENEDQVQHFLSKHTDFELEPVTKDLLPEEVIYLGSYLGTFPHVHNTDGAFAARLRRQQR